MEFYADIGVDAGPVPNKADLQRFSDIITERLKGLYLFNDGRFWLKRPKGNAPA
jgi:hypothetical protein